MVGPQAGLTAYISGNVHSLSLIVSFTIMANTKQTERKYKSKEEEEAARKRIEEEAEKKAAESKKKRRRHSKGPELGEGEILDTEDTGETQESQEGDSQ